MTTIKHSQNSAHPWLDLIDYSNTAANGKSPTADYCNIYIFLLEVMLFIKIIYTFLFQ